jgi:hypothetical protein
VATKKKAKKKAQKPPEVFDMVDVKRLVAAMIEETGVRGLIDVESATEIRCNGRAVARYVAQHFMDRHNATIKNVRVDGDTFVVEMEPLA